MTFRSKLFWVFTIALLLSLGAIAAGVTLVTRQAFDELNRQHTDALIAQFNREFSRRSQEVVQRVKGIADDQITQRMAIDLSLPKGDPSIYVDDAHGLSQSHQLDFLDLLTTDGTIISSAEWHARFGYKMDWVTQPEDWAARGPFLMKVDTQDGPALALMAVATVPVADKGIYVVGGEHLGKEFLASLVLPTGTRALLYLNLTPDFQEANLLSASQEDIVGERLAPIVEDESKAPGEMTRTIYWTSDTASAEAFHAIPLQGRQKELLGVLLVGSSQQNVVMLERRILLFALAMVGFGLLVGAMLSWWGTARVTRPIRNLVEGSRAVSEGNWGARVEVRGGGEIAQLARSFNQMTQQLVDQRERLVQAERVAAWRDVARRLAHELKNPLFPLQTTVENLQRARKQRPDQFDEVLRESTGILLSEIENLKAITGRFSDFAKMPQPELVPLNVNDVVRSVVKLFEAQFGAVGRPPITPELHLDESIPTVEADPVLLHRAVENVVLNAMDAMPAGGVIMLRTSSADGSVSLEIGDTGTGLTPEETERLFTPYYTTKQHGTGLGLAIVQSIVSDHGGRVSVESEAGVGTTFRIEFPVKPPRRPPVPPAANAERKEA